MSRKNEGDVRLSSVVEKYLRSWFRKEAMHTTLQNGCITDELMGALLEGKLKKSERDQILGHAAECQKCYAWMVQSFRSQELMAATQPSGRLVSFPAWLSWRPLLAAAVFLFAIAAAILLQRSGP